MENKQKKRMLLFGPGFGHNTEAKLQKLSETTDFEVTFMSLKTDMKFVAKHPKIHFIPTDLVISKSSVFKSLKTIWIIFKNVRLSGHIDVVYSLGEGGVIAALFFLIAKKQTKRALEIWSCRIVETSFQNRTLPDRLDRYVIKRADLICQYWWGIRELFVNKYPQYENKFLMYQLSYPDIFFANEKHYPESEFVKNFIDSIPRNQKVCFWPRSFIPANNHRVLLEAIGIIKIERPDILSDFKLYLWGGNVFDDASVNIIKETIDRCSITNHVEIVEHPFVSQNDIFAIEERSDFFVQIANHDILSTFIMEILCSGKPFIISNLRTFQFLNEKYDLDIDFVENDPNKIAKRMMAILSNKYKDEKADKRKMLCKNYFSYSHAKPWTKILLEAL